ELRRVLSKAVREEGYGVVEADSGDQALDRALDGGHSCIILDVMLPGRDGFSVVEELRRRGVFTPVLLLTAKDELESRVRGLEGGADDYLTKPFDLSELIARVHALIRRAELRHQDATLKVGPLKLNPRARHRLPAGGPSRVTERRLATVLTRRFSRVAWTALAGYAVLVVIAFAVAAEMVLRRSLEHSADVIESLLGAYGDSTQGRGGVM